MNEAIKKGAITSVISKKVKKLSKNKTINVNGGNQVRPHVHIEDMVDTYHFFIERKKINGIYNVGFENHSIINIAKIIKNKLPSVSIKIKKSIDTR